MTEVRGWRKGWGPGHQVEHSLRPPLFEHRCMWGKGRGELQEHAVRRLRLSPSTHPTQGAQPGTPGATWVRAWCGSRGKVWGAGWLTVGQLLGGACGQKAGEGGPQTGSRGQFSWTVPAGAGRRGWCPRGIQAPAQGVEAPDLPPLRRAREQGARLPISGRAAPRAP